MVLLTNQIILGMVGISFELMGLILAGIVGVVVLIIAIVKQIEKRNKR